MIVDVGAVNKATTPGIIVQSIVLVTKEIGYCDVSFQPAEQSDTDERTDCKRCWSELATTSDNALHLHSTSLLSYYVNIFV